jgi:serine/threonine protein kinase
MKPTHDPEEVDQTLLPSASAKAPAASPPARPAKSASNHGDAPSHPVASDVTVDLPTPSPSPALHSEVDPNTTVDHSSSTPTTGNDTHAGNDPTLLPTSISVDDTPKTIADASGEAGATLPMPIGRTLATGTGSTGPLGSDTSPLSVSTGHGGKSGASPSADGTMVGRFALKDLHASGGLGEVFKARDTELNREVAVKRIKSQFADDVGSRRRFLSEAELTAKLDHPGVVPVFGLVNDVRGRPCYAMRFIRGETLKDEIDRYHNQGSGTRKQESEKTEKTEAKAAESKPAEAAEPAPEPTAVPRTVAFRHLLSRFIATCQAIAYAHSRNIIHRDIKPANIMVGSFGETLVVDWGLAKSLDDGPDFDRMMRNASNNGLRHDPEATDLPSHMTMAGTAVGTPAYMSPEQAAGDLAKVGPQSDIYALGATLFVILTGKAPVTGKTTIEVLNRVRRGEYDPALKVNPEAPKPLDAIARKAMALRPEDRYATALDLAADVEKWLSDEPVSCYQDPFFERLARWARRNPARVATAVSLLIAGILAAGVIAWVIHASEKSIREERDNVVKEQKKTSAALEQVTQEQGRTKAALDQVTIEQTRTEEQRKEAVTARNVARNRYDTAVAAYNVLVTDIDKKLADRAGMQDLRKKLLEKASEGLQQLIAGGGEERIKADRTLVAAYRQMGEVYQILGDTAKARDNFNKAVLQASLVQMDARTAVERAQQTAPEQVATATAEKRAADRDLGRSLDKLAGIHLQAGDSKAALDAIDSAIKLFEKLAEDPNDAEAQKDLAAAKARRATILMNRGNTRKALEDCNAALAVRQKLSDAAPNDLERKRDLAASLDALAGLQLQTGNTKDALVNAQRCVQVRTEISEANKERPEIQRELADAYTRIGEAHFERAEMTKAASWYQRGVDVLKALANEDEKSVLTNADLVAMYGRLGQVQLRTGNIEEAVANTLLGKDLAIQLQKTDPDSAKAKRDLALARSHYGDALLAIGRTQDGISEYTEARNLLDPLRTADKDSARAKLDLARTLERLGDGCMANKDMAGAIVAYRASVELRQEVKEKDAGSTSAKREFALGQYKLASAYCGQGKPGEAEAYATSATKAFVELATLDPGSAQTQRDIALGYAKLGQVLDNGGHATSALIVWQNSLDRCEKLVKIDAGNLQAKEDEAYAWERLASFYAARGYTDRALVSAKNAVELWAAIANITREKTKAGRQRLALAMLRYGDISADMLQLGDAREWYKKAAKEVEGESKDPLLGPVADLVKTQQEFLEAVEAVLKNPPTVMTFSEKVRVPALRTVAMIELRADHHVNADAIARQLAKIAKIPADKFAVARIYAVCAAIPRVNDDTRKYYATDAVKYLKLAIDADFRDFSALSTPEWDAVRQLVPEFAKVRRELEKKIEGK